jgi:hypothetical protein
MKHASSKYVPWLGLLLISGAVRAADGPIVNGQNAENVVGQTTPGGGPDFDNVGPYDTALLTGLMLPYGVAIDTTTHRLFVADAAHRILVYDLNTSNILVDRTPDHVLGQIDFYGDALATDPNRLYYPVDLDYDAVSNRLFVADYSNSRVLIFDVTSITDGENAVHVLGQSDFTERRRAEIPTLRRWGFPRFQQRCIRLRALEPNGGPGWRCVWSMAYTAVDGLGTLPGALGVA